MPFLSAIGGLRILVCDNSSSSTGRLVGCLQNQSRLVESVHTVCSLDDAHRTLGALPINTIFIDPIGLGIEEASKFVFRARQKLPWIAFVLYVDPSKVKQTPDFYVGHRSRWQHYFTLSKKLSRERFSEEVFHTIHLCLSDVRLADSLTRTRLQLEFVTQFGPPNEIRESLELFRQRFPHTTKTAFIMMQFGNTPAHSEIAAALKSVLSDFGIVGLRGDDLEFHSDLVYNVLTYVYGCDFGIAVFERISEDNFNPNVSLEVGYMMALRKPICLLKDKNLKTLHADLIGKLYRPFDPYKLRESIGAVMKKWIGERAFPIGDALNRNDESTKMDRDGKQGVNGDS